LWQRVPAPLISESETFTIPLVKKTFTSCLKLKQLISR
jgi:hypothetical protein